MADELTLEQLEQHIVQLPPPEQLKLAAHICERLSITAQTVTLEDEEALRQQRQEEADRLLALCDAAAAMWDGEFDAAEEIHQMRQERSSQ